jgi:hypothetical protein
MKIAVRPIALLFENIKSPVLAGLLGSVPEVFRRLFAATGDDVVLDLLTFVQASHPGLFYRRHVHKHILAAVIWLNEPETLGPVEPLNCTAWQFDLLD